LVLNFIFFINLIKSHTQSKILLKSKNGVKLNKIDKTEKLKKMYRNLMFIDAVMLFVIRFSVQQTISSKLIMYYLKWPM
jgi:hypothetical protein